MFTKAFIPFRGYYSSPFVRWQGSLANQHPIPLAAETTKAFMNERGVDPESVDYVNFGSTVAQPQIFFGGPWTAALTGCDRVPGVWISQACSTSTTAVYQAAMAVELGSAETVLNVLADRCSNGPHLTWPNPNGPGAQMLHEDWVQDNFNRDPWAGKAMIATAETVAKESGLTRDELDQIALRRYEQYQDGLSNDRAFQKGYLRPLEVRVSKKQTVLVETDEGIIPTTTEGLAKLQPVLPDGVHTYGTQTHPADGNAAILVTTRERAQAIAPDGPAVQVLSFGYAREKKCFMPAAPVPAARMALERAGLAVDDIKVIKTHNPFAANDAYLAKEFGIDPMGFNNYGSPLIYGHPQGPTAARCVIEMIEELALLGGGTGLFTGCAAGDTAASLVLRVG